jgi:predicted secreted protein
MARSAYGATISLAGSALTQVTSIGVPSLTGEVIDVSTHASTGRWREFIRGMREAGEFSVTMLYIAGSAADTACRGAITADAPVAVTITAAATTGTQTLTISAFGTEYSVNDLEPDGSQTATLTLKPTGAVTQAATA